MMKHYSTVTKLVHYTSKFASNDDGRHTKRHPSPKNHRSSSPSDVIDRSIESKKFRLAPIWPEWIESEINAEPWEAVTSTKKRDLMTGRPRADTKTNFLNAHIFEDPEGKIELPPSLKVEQWKRPIDFLPTDKLPVIVDSDIGIQNFDLITSNEHLHYNETMRNIISQIIILWDICRKNPNKISNNTNESNIIEHTWRPWEHIYALNKVSKQPFITPYNPSGKYVVRLFFLGAWRKIIIDDTIPFNSKNQCLLPQTSLSYELWPMLLTKALLKIISLNFNSSNDFPEHNETSIIHLLTGWIPEPIPLKYSHAEKVWNFLRYDRSNKLLGENESPSTISFGPIPLYKWPELKNDSPEEIILTNANKQDQVDQSDDKNSKKVGTTINPIIPKEPTVIKPTNIKENRTNTVLNSNNPKDTRKQGIAASRGIPIEDTGVTIDDQMIPEAPKMIVFATISHLQSTRFSSYSETADRSERLRHYNLNDILSTSILLTTIRDIPLEPPPPAEYIPAWKLIRPRKPKVLPHAEPITPQESKPERWIEISSPYINYPTTSALNIKPTIRLHPIDSSITPSSTPSHSNRATKRSSIVDPLHINEIDEDEDIENGKIKAEFNTEFVRSTTNLSIPISSKELIDVQEKSDGSIRSAPSKLKRELSIDKNKIPRKSIAVATKILSDTVSTKSKGGESEQIINPITVQQSSQSTNSNSLKKSFITPKIWMNFDDFCACFSSIIVFHNPRGYQYTHKHTEIKFVPYQQPVVVPVTKERRKEPNPPVVQQIPELQDDKSSLYLFVDSTRETLNKNIELIISLTCLSRWYDAIPIEIVLGTHEKAVRGASVSNEKSSIDVHQSKFITSQKDIIPQAGSLIAEIYSWKSLSIGQSILRLHTTATKAALLTLPPGRHVLKFLNTCSFAYNLQILSDNNDFMIGNEDQLLNKILSVPEDAEFILKAEELFLALDNSVQIFHLINQNENKLHDLFRLYCQQAPKSINLTIQTCLNAFNQALYSTLRTILNTSGSLINTDTQFAWRCFTNDLSTPDILSAYETKRTNVQNVSRHSARSGGSFSTNLGGSNPSKKSSGTRDKSSDDKISLKHQTTALHSSSVTDMQEETVSDLLTRELSINEIRIITNIQKSARGFLQRCVDLARTCGTERNLLVQQMLQTTMSLLKVDFNKSALSLFRNFISNNLQLNQCFSFYNDDWNMVTYRDYHGMYQEQLANTWFILFREIFYVDQESLITVKFCSHLPNSLLRVINNDTYEEIPIVFNRLAPAVFTKNKHGYTFFAEGISPDQILPNGRFRLRLITSYARLPEPHTDQITSSFITKEIMDYYLPNRQQIICRCRIILADDINQTGRNFHLASIHFSTSKPDVLMRLTILDNNEEIVSIEGKGCLILPAIHFMRTVTNIIQSPQPSSKLSFKSGGSRRKDTSNPRRGSFSDATTTTTTITNNVRSDRDRIGSGKRSRSNSRAGFMTIDEEEKLHKYIIQVTVLRKSWPLTLTQWQFVEQLKEHEKTELKVFNRRPSSPIKPERPTSSSSTHSKRAGHTHTGRTRANTTKGNTTPVGRPSTAKGNIEKLIDTTKPHWTLRIVSDSDKADELIIKKDTEYNDEYMNKKKAWETLQVGRAEKAMQTRQKFLDNYQLKTDECSSSEITNDSTNQSDIRTDDEIINTIHSPIIEQQQQNLIIKKTLSLIKKEFNKDEIFKENDSISLSPLMDEPPSTKPKITLLPLDIKPFIKQKFLSNQPIVFNQSFEEKEFEHRQNTFNQYSILMKNIHDNRQEDENNRYKEKIRQLEEYINLQDKINQTRRIMNEPREAFRQQFLEIERKRLQQLAIQEQKLINQSTTRIIKKKNSAGKKKKK